MAASLGAVQPLLPPGATSHPAFDPLRGWLPQLGERPGFAELNALAEASASPPVTAARHAVRFCPPASTSARQYEQRVFDSGRVETRPDNVHDLFNALAWLAFPRTKAVINARHVARLPADGNVRGPLRDLLTLVDEGGVIVACAEDSLSGFESLIRSFRWQALFWDRRSELLKDMRCVLVGHAAYEKALTPYPGITCKALFIATPRARLEGPYADLVAWLDGEAAVWLAALPEDAAPHQMAPLPVFGYPGWLADSGDAGFYADQRWFRPGRASVPVCAEKPKHTA